MIRLPEGMSPAETALTILAVVVIMALVMWLAR